MLIKTIPCGNFFLSKFNRALSQISVKVMTSGVNVLHAKTVELHLFRALGTSK